MDSAADTLQQPPVKNGESTPMDTDEPMNNPDSINENQGNFLQYPSCRIYV